jgi:hypothetical protein
MSLLKRLIGAVGKADTSIESELSAWGRDEVNALRKAVARVHQCNQATAIDALNLARSVKAVAQHEQQAFNEYASLTLALGAIADTLELSAQRAQAASDDVELKSLDAACEELINTGVKDMKECRKRCDKARADFAAATHRVNAAQANVKFVPPDLHKLIELEVREMQRDARAFFIDYCALRPNAKEVRENCKSASANCVALFDVKRLCETWRFSMHWHLPPLRWRVARRRRTNYWRRWSRV